MTPEGTARRPGREPADEEPGIERIAGTGRVGRRDRCRRDLESEASIAVAGQDRGALRAALDDGDRRDVQQALDRVPAEQGLGLGRGREQDVRGDLVDQRAGRPTPAGQQRADRGEIDADRRARPRGRARSPRRPARLERLVEQRIDRQVHGVGAREPGRLEVGRPELQRRGAVLARTSARRRARRGRRSVPVRAPATRTTRGVDAIARGAPRPAPGLPRSRPTAATSDDRAPSRPSQRAVVAADPPWASPTRPGTSVPCSSGRSGRSTTSTTRSPITTIRGRPGERRGRLGRRDGMASRIPAATRPTMAAPTGPSPRPSRTVECLPMAAVTTDLDRLCHRHDPHAVDRWRAGRRTPGTRARRWAPRRWPTSCGRGSCATRRRHPDWPDRDRFVLSAGHASMLLYSLLHLTGYDLPLDELKRVPAVGIADAGAPGVRADARRRGDDRAARPGLRQRRRHGDRGAPARRPSSTATATRSSTTGRTSSRRMATSRRASRRRRRRWPATCACGKLVVLYDDNHVQLDGPTSMAWSEDVPKRFEAYGWHASRVDDGNDLAAIEAAINGGPRRRPPEPHRGPHAHRLRQPEQAGFAEGARRRRSAPTRSASPRRRTAGIPDRTFYVPADALSRLPPGRAGRRAALRGVEREAGTLRGRPRRPGRGVPAADRRHAPAGLGRRASRPTPSARRSRRATRRRTRSRPWPDRVPELFGGAADLSESNLTDVKGEPNFSADEPGRNLRFGVREHGMGGIANGIAYHGGFIPYDATFLTFSDYMRGAVRLSAPRGSARHPRLDARLGRARRGRPDPPVGRALRGPAGDPEPVVRPAGRRQRDVGRMGAGRRAAATGRSRWRLPARSSPCWPARPRRRVTACGAAATSCARPAVGARR